MGLAYLPHQQVCRSREAFFLDIWYDSLAEERNYSKPT